MMSRQVWNKLMQYESRDLIERHYKARHQKVPSARKLHEISSNFTQAREYFINANKSAISVKPLLLYYGVSALSRGLTLILSANSSESSMKPSHGLDTSNWQECLANKKYDQLTIKIKEGTFFELIKATGNKTYFKNNTNYINYQLSYPVPKLESKISLIQLFRTLPALKEEFYLAFQEELIHAELVSIKKEGDSVIYNYKNSIDSNVLGEKIFGDGYFDNICHINNSEVKALANLLPQLCHITNDSLGVSLGEIVITQKIGREICLNMLSQYYCLSFFLGMLSRYFPTDWMSLSRTSKGDAIYPLIVLSIDAIEIEFPKSILEFLQDGFEFDNGN